MKRTLSRRRAAALLLFALLLLALFPFLSWGQAPTAPTSLYISSTDAQSGDASPASGIDLTPVFSATFNDADAGALGKKIKIQVSNDQTFAVVTHWNSGQIAIADVANGARCQNVDYNGQALSGLTTYFWRCKFWDETDTDGAWSAAATFTTGPAPYAPSTLFVDSTDATVQTSGNPVTEIDQSPVFTALFTHQSSGSVARVAKIQVSTDASFATVTHWNSGQLTIASTAHNTRTPNIAYNGQYLQGDTVFYWRIRLTDELGNVSAWSTEPASFRTILVPSAPIALQVGSIEAQTGASGNPVTDIDVTPVFSAVVSHPNAAMPATQVKFQVSTDSTFASITHWNSGKITISTTLPAARCPDVAYNGQPLSGQATYYWRVRFFASDGGVSEWSTVAASFTTQAAPSIATSLFVGSTEAQTGAQGDPVNLIDLNPAFSAIYHHQSAVAGTKVKVQVSTDATFADVTHWNSGQITIASVADGTRSADVTYNGQLLRGNTRYYWRLRFYDSNDNPGPWSAEAASFITILAPVEPTNLFVSSQSAQSGSSGISVVGVDLTPVFSALMHHQDPAGLGKKIKIQVTTDSTFNTLTHWNSGNISISNVTDGARCQDIAYAGSALANSTTYYWRCRFVDAYPSNGLWSIEAASFTTEGAGTPEPATLDASNLKQGAAYNVTITKSGGAAFASSNTFDLTGGGLMVTSVQALNANSLQVSFTVNELAAAGNRTFEVRSGSSAIASGPAYIYYPSQRVPSRRGNVAQEPLLNPALVSAGVVAATGEFLFEAQDILLPGRMLPLGFGRNYRSFLEFDGTMGQSWASVVDEQLRYDSTSDSIAYFSADGRLHTLTLGASGVVGVGPYVETGSYVEWSRADQDDSDPLNDVYTALGAHGDRAVYVASNFDTEGRQVYRLVSMADRFNNAVALLRDAIGRVTEIRGDLYLATEPTRHRLILDYGPDGRLKSIEDFADYTGEPAEIVGSFTGPRTWNFNYDGSGRLVEVLLPKTKDWFDDEVSSLSSRARLKYEYTNTSFPNLITDVHSPRQVALFQFDGSGRSWLRTVADAQGRVVAQDIGRSAAADTTHRHHVIYGSGTCDVVDPLGRRVRVTLQSGRVQAKAQFTGFFDSSLTQTTPKLRTTDPDTFVTTFEYNNQGELTRMTLPRGNIAAWFYDNASASQRAKGNLLRQANLPGTADIQGLPPVPAGQQNGILTVFTYSTDFNLLTTTVDPRAYDLQTDYDITQAGQLARDDSAEFTTTRVYDALGQLNRIETPVVSEAKSPLSPNVNQQVKVSFLYNSYGQVTQQADISDYPSPEVGLVTDFEYGTTGFSRSRLIRTRSAPAGSDFKVEYNHDSLGFPKETTNNAGATTTAHRDQHERVRRTFAPALAHLNGHRYRRDFEFDREGNPTKQTIFDPILEADGSLAGAAPREITSFWAVDILGNITSTIDEPTTGTPRIFSSVYDNAFQLVETHSAAGLKGVTQFDERGLGFKTYSGLLASETNLQQALNIRTLAYDLNGNLNALTDGRGYTRTAGYDAYDRTVKATDARQPDSTVGTAVYDHAGNLIETSVFGKKSASSTGILTQSRAYFDNLGRSYRTGRLAVKNDGTTALGYSAGPSTSNDTLGWAMETFKFLPDGRLLSSVRDYLDAATPALSTPDVVLGYDDLGRLVRQTDRGNNLATFAYDLAGNLITMNDYRFDQDSNQQTLLVRHTTYDEMGRAISQHLDNDTPATSRWNAVGMIAHQFSTQSGTTRYSYDGAWRLASMVRSGSGTWSISSSTGAVSQNGSQSLTTVYRYDADDNLRQVIDNGGNQTLRLYDLLGRHVRTTFPDGTTFTISATAGVGSVVAGEAYVPATGGYNAEGNVLSIFDEGGNHIVRTYDTEGQILTLQVTPATSSATLIGEVSATYSCDGLGRILSANNTDRAAHVITRDQTWNSLSKLESTLVVENQTHARANNVNELGLVESFEQSGANTAYEYDHLDRVISTRVTHSGTLKFAGAALYHGRVNHLGAISDVDDQDAVQVRDGRGRVVESTLRSRSSNETELTRIFEYCPCGFLRAVIDDWRPALGKAGRVQGTRFYQDGLGRRTGTSVEADFPDSGSNRWSDSEFGGNTRSTAVEFDSMDVPSKRSLFVGATEFSEASAGFVQTPHVGSYGSTSSPLPPGQGSDFLANSIGDVSIGRSGATGPNVTDDGVFKFRYDHRGRLVDTTRQSDNAVIEERRYDALGIEGNRSLVDMEVESLDFSMSDTSHVWFSRADVSLDGGGVKFSGTDATGIANMPFPGNLHHEVSYDGPEGATVSYHDFLVQHDVAGTRIGNFGFSSTGASYRLKLEVDAAELRLFEQVNAFSGFVQIGSNGYSSSGPQLNLGVRIDLGEGAYGSDVAVEVWLNGSLLISATRAQGFQRFAPTRVQFETQGDWGRLYRYHGYLGTTSLQGQVRVVQGRPDEEFFRRALCGTNPPSESESLLTRAQAARLELMGLQNELAQTINGWAMALGLDQSQLTKLANNLEACGSQPSETGDIQLLKEALTLSCCTLQTRINALDIALTSKEEEERESHCIDGMVADFVAPQVYSEQLFFTPPPGHTPVMGGLCGVHVPAVVIAHEGVERVVSIKWQRQYAQDPLLLLEDGFDGTPPTGVQIVVDNTTPQEVHGRLIWTPPAGSSGQEFKIRLSSTLSSWVGQDWYFGRSVVTFVVDDFVSGPTLYHDALQYGDDGFLTYEMGAVVRIELWAYPPGGADRQFHFNATQLLDGAEIQWSEEDPDHAVFTFPYTTYYSGLTTIGFTVQDASGSDYREITIQGRDYDQFVKAPFRAIRDLVLWDVGYTGCAPNPHGRLIPTGLVYYPHLYFGSGAGAELDGVETLDNCRANFHYSNQSFRYAQYWSYVCSADEVAGGIWAYRLTAPNSQLLTLFGAKEHYRQKAAKSRDTLEAVLDDIAANMAAWKYSAGYYADRLTERLRSMAQVQAAARLEEENSGFTGFLKGRVQAALDNSILLPLARIKEVIRPFAAILDRQQDLLANGISPHDAFVRAFGEQVMTETGMRGIVEGIDGRDMVNRGQLGAFEQQAHFILGAAQLASLVFPVAKAGSALFKGGPSVVLDSVGGTRIPGKLYGEARLNRLAARLKKKGVSIERNADAVLDQLPDKPSGAFQVDRATNEAKILLRSNPTEYEVLHEYQHFRDFRVRGRFRASEYELAPQVVREQFVYDRLRSKNSIWSRFEAVQQRHAVNYINGFRGGDSERWRGCNP